jgi:hypothetical protein
VNTHDLQSVIQELVGVIDTSSGDLSLNSEGQRTVLRFVARVVHVVEQALQDVYVLAVDVKHIRPGDAAEIARLSRELDLVLMRSHAKSEGICSRLHALREVFESDVSLLLRCTPGDPRWHQLFWLLDDREGRVIQLIQNVVQELKSALQTLEQVGFFGRSKTRDEVRLAAEEASVQLRAALGELREIRDKILGLSGQAGLLELTEDSPEQFRQEARALTVKITTGDLYRTEIQHSMVGALAVGDHATATGTATVQQGTLTQEQHRAAIKEAQKALLDDEDRLDALVSEALGQFLLLARKIQVEQQNLAQVQAKMKETLDEVWAQQVVKGMKSQALPQGLKVIGALAASPVTAEVAKKLLTG